MEQYRESLKKRITYYAVGMLLLCNCIYIGDKWLGPKGGVDASIEGFAIGLLIAIEMILVVLIIKTHKAIRNDEELKKFYIRENDERRRYIKKSIGAPTTLFVYFFLILATIVSGVINPTVFKTLVVIDMGVGAIIVGMKIYYLKKY